MSIYNLPTITVFNFKSANARFSLREPKNEKLVANSLVKILFRILFVLVGMSLPPKVLR